MGRHDIEKRHDIVWSGCASSSRHQREDNKTKDCIREPFAILHPSLQSLSSNFPLDNVQQICTSRFLCWRIMCLMVCELKIQSIFGSAVWDPKC